LLLSEILKKFAARGQVLSRNEQLDVLFAIPVADIVRVARRIAKNPCGTRGNPWGDNWRSDTRRKAPRLRFPRARPFPGGGPGLRIRRAARS
jgi:hypothetical protein